jgi:hypothetical protein
MKSKKIRPGIMPFWMLNDASTVEQKIQYMRICRSAGIEALIMHSRLGNLIPYASKEWFEMIAALVDEGSRIDMDMWLYDEDPYPSGAAGGWVMAEHPELQAEYISCKQPNKKMREGELWEIGDTKILWAGLVPCRRKVKPVEMTDRIGVIRKDWFMTKWDSRYYYPDTPVFSCPRGDVFGQTFVMRVPHIPSDYTLQAFTLEKAGVEGEWGSMPDLLNPETFSVFKHFTLDPYQKAVGHHYGKTIPGIFTDEAKPQGGMPYTKDLFHDFKTQYGYSLRERLYQLFGALYSEEYTKTRIDYRRWVANRFLRAFVKPYRSYCDEVGLYLIGHFSPEDDPIEEAHTLGSVMPIMKTTSSSGTDLIVPCVGTAQAPALNLGSLKAGSVRMQQNKPMAMSETMVCSNWNITSAKTRQILTWQKVLGIDRIVLHAFFMANEGVQNYDAPPTFGPYNPIFKGISEVNNWLKQLDSITDNAKDIVEVAILNSVRSYWKAEPGNSNKHLENLRKYLWNMLLSCLQAHVPVHIVDENDIADASIQKGYIKIGRCFYNTILIPPLDILEKNVMDVLSQAAGLDISVFWFGNNKPQIIDKSYQACSVSRLPGKIVTDNYPGRPWCAGNLTPAVKITGKDSKLCYIRRIKNWKGQQYLLAVNTADKLISLNICAENKNTTWLPVNIDGSVDFQSGKMQWTVPAGGCGVFSLSQPNPMPTQYQTKEYPVNRRKVTFKREKHNLLRLNSPMIKRAGYSEQHLEYPQAYWQMFDDYTVRKSVSTFGGELPLDGKVNNVAVDYCFKFHLRQKEHNLKLVMDPRCARGSMQVYINGDKLGKARYFPMNRTQSLKIPLKGLRKGVNNLVIRFNIKHPLEGLLSQLYIEGNFDVTADSVYPSIIPATANVSDAGWQKSGMPHYMGSALYKWTHNFSRSDIESGIWYFMAENIIDAGELFVNNKSAGLKAWEKWSWQLNDLQPGRNTFVLKVWGTAGNKHGIEWCDQPQGWIGKGWFRRWNQT